jgi:L-galactose dehydrogenase/L-glyceraldehyde 3-phosphate reductase
VRYRPFGKTGLQVSELVFGGGAVGGLLIDQPDDIKKKAFDLAIQGGINWIDTAPSYGQGRSESALGWLLKTAKAPPYISTKFSIDTRDLGNLENQIRSSLEASLTRLQMDSVTLLQLHNSIGHETRGRTIAAEEILKSGGVIDCLDKIRGEGLIQHFGITALGETSAIIRVITSARIDSAQVYYNLLNPSAGMPVPTSWPVYDFSSILSTCETHQVATMNIRVFSAGVIATNQRTGREMPLTSGDTVESETKKAEQIFSSIGGDFGTRAQTAIRFALAQNRMSCIVFGLAELDHLEEALKAEEMGALSRQAINQIISVYQE